MVVRVLVSHTSLHTFPHAGRERFGRPSWARTAIGSVHNIAAACTIHRIDCAIIAGPCLFVLGVLGGSIPAHLPIDLPPNAEDVGVRIRHTGVDKIHQFMLVVEDTRATTAFWYQLTPNTTALLKPRRRLAAVAGSGGDDVVTVVEIDPRIADRQFPRAPSATRPLAELHPEKRLERLRAVDRF